MGKNLLTIGLTMGDPAGIGPEIVVKAALDPEIRAICHPLVIGDVSIISSVATALGVTAQIVDVSIERPDVQASPSINVWPVTNLEHVRVGRISKEAGYASGLYIERGVQLATDKNIDALVTAPINKESFHLGGFNYPGHTEFLAQLTGTDDFAMMLMGPTLKVILLTIHCQLMEVANALNPQETLRIIRLTYRCLRRYFGINEPKLALAALNPHAGEGGLFGDEEERALLPAVENARKEGVNISAPQPPDTVFYRAVIKKEFDAVICPYHDQALIPLKLLHFDDGVNVTLGLPIIRCSPDHGAAYDIAGKGVANPQSLKAAIKTAAHMAKAA